MQLLGCEVDCLDIAQTVERCDELIRSGARAHQVSINAAKLIAMRQDARMREIVHSADVVSADGMSIVWASRLLGHPLPGRVPGIDLMLQLLWRARNNSYRIFILGARTTVLERAVERLTSLYPGLIVSGYHDGYFDEAESEAVCAQIRAAEPHILFVAMSSPRKEYWVSQHRAGLEIPLMVGVGGAIDVVAGVVRRAPPWMQSSGLEWIFRLLQEPRRLWRRYLVTNTQFALLLAKELFPTWFSRVGRDS